MRDWKLRRGELIAIFIFWMALATFSAVNRLLDPRGPSFRFISPTGPILLGYIEALLWAGLTPVIFFISAWAVRARMNVVFRAAAVLIGGVLIASIANMVLDFFRFEMFEVPRRRAALMTPLLSLRVSLVNQLFVYFAAMAAGFAREYSERDRLRQRETEHLAVEAAQLQAQLAQARLEALRMQINPHFLFNTLHAVSALVERDPAGVRRMIARLSELLRYTLDTAATQEVPLRQELGFVQRYVEIMNVRFQGKLEFSEEIAPGLDSALVPSLIMQPLVENALKHGVSRSHGSGRVTLTARRDGDRLVVAVTDDGPGPGAATSETGIGLANTRERLQQMYGDAGSLTLRGAGGGGGTTAEITVPFRVQHA
ncbi:MAG TPA: histidine kinase [Thermoanaerobaculia bacterium]|nr:histidine kinase [Thermoanaerobaculia bacterium]